MKILVTGCAGFVGFSLCKKILDSNNHKIFGIDNLNNYYDVNLKKSRLNILKKNKFIISKAFLTFTSINRIIEDICLGAIRFGV